MLKTLTLILFLSFTLSGFGQEGEESSPAAPTATPEGGRVIIRETSPAAHSPETQATTEDRLEDDEADLAALEEARQKQLEKAKLIEQSTDPLKDPLGNPTQQLLKLTKGQISAAMLMDDKIQAALTRIFSEGHMSRASREETVQLLQAKTKGSFMEKMFLWFPSLLQISVDVVRDSFAMPGLIKILTRKDDLKTFGYIWLAVFIFGMLIRNRLVKPKLSFFKRRIYSLSISLPLNILTLYIFYSMFGEEITPTLEIMARHWF
jgi:hypothetical protein